MPNDIQNLRTASIPARYLSNPDHWRRLGNGVLSWSVFKIYEATVWINSPDAYFNADQHFALQLDYLRNIAGNQLAASSMAEMIRLYPESALHFSAWQKHLDTIARDMQRGDTLTIEFHPTPDIGARFFLNDAFLAEVADVGFADAFAAIWLDPRTKAPDLRAKLLAL